MPDHKVHNSFTQIQYAFTAHIRQPENNAAPENIEDRRMKIYRDLFYNNVEGFMSTTYPVLHEILGEQRWHTLIRDYFANHKAHTPLFPEMPREFLVYLEEERQPQADDLPFMLELAHYEWIELALSISELTNDKTKLSTQTDFVNEIPVLSNLAWLLSYQYPVQHISKDFQPEQHSENSTEQLTHIIASRLEDSEQVNFTEVNPVVARLLQLVSENKKSLTGKALLTQIAKELGNPDTDSIIEFGLQTLNDLHKKEIIIGTLKQ